MRKARGEYHHGDLRRALVRAAAEHLERHDARELSLRKLARHAGVSSAAPYRHFASRDALLAAVAEDGYRELAAEIRDALRELPDDPVERLAASGVAYVRFARRKPAHYRVMFGEELVGKSAFPELAGAAAESMGLLMEIIELGIERGVFRGEDPRVLAVAAWSVVHGLASLEASGQLAVLGAEPGAEPGADPDALARRVTAALLSGVAVQREAEIGITRR